MAGSLRGRVALQKVGRKTALSGFQVTTRQHEAGLSSAGASTTSASLGARSSSGPTHSNTHPPAAPTVNETGDEPSVNKRLRIGSYDRSDMRATTSARGIVVLAFVGIAALLIARLPDWVTLATHPEMAASGQGVDFVLYRDAASEWLAGQPFYLQHQLAGPYAVTPGDRLYPPPALLLFAPFTVLPAVLWWAIPGIVVAAVLWRLRPRPAAWLFLAFVAWWPPTTVKIWTGNPVIWVAAALWLATLWRPAAVTVFLKPTLTPFAFFGANRRDWWMALAVAALTCALFAPMWPDYLTATLNARDTTGILYSIQEVPMMAAPLVAFALSRQSTIVNARSPKATAPSA